MKKLPLLFFLTILLFSCNEKKTEKEITENTHKKDTIVEKDDLYFVSYDENTTRYSCMLEDYFGLTSLDKLYSTENETITYFLYNNDKTKVEIFLPYDGACNVLGKIEENIYQQEGGGYYRLETKNGHQLFYKNKLIYTQKK